MIFSTIVASECEQKHEKQIASTSIFLKGKAKKEKVIFSFRLTSIKRRTIKINNFNHNIFEMLKKIIKYVILHQSHTELG